MKTKSSPKSVKPPTSIPLASLDVPVTGASEAPTGKVELLTVPVTGEALAEYVKHAANEKAAQAEMKKLRPNIETLAVQHIIQHNLDMPNSPVSTAKLVDEAGNAANISFKDSYKELDLDLALTTLAALGIRDPNPYIQERVVVGFDTAVFYEESGDLKSDLYVDMLNAITRVAKEHGVASPFSSRKAASVRPDFHQKRWSIPPFGLIDAKAIQNRLRAVFPNTVSLTPQAPAKPTVAE